MKGIRRPTAFICSAIAALSMLAMAGCDLGLRDDPLGETGKTIRKTLPSLATANSDGTYTATCAYVTNAGTTLRFEEGVVTEKTGVALSFCITNAITSDWTDVLTTKSTITRLATMDYLPDGVYECHAFEASTLVGKDYTTYLEQACFVTISFNADGSIYFYKDGAAMTTENNAAKKFDGSTHTIKDQCAALIADLAAGGSVTANVAMKNLTATAAVDADAAKALYTSLKAK